MLHGFVELQCGKRDQRRVANGNLAVLNPFVNDLLKSVRKMLSLQPCVKPELLVLKWIVMITDVKFL